jgi:hypothetical protein
MGPLSAKSHPGRDLVRPQPPPAGRARQEVDYGRRGKGCIFGAFCPATGAALTRPYPGRGAANWVAFLEEVESWLPQDIARVYAIADNLSSHRGADGLLFLLAHPRWEMVLQPKYAAYLNLVRGTAANAVVEGAALAGARRAPLRDMGRGRRGRRAGDRPLECAPPPLHLGAAATSSPAPAARHRALA